MDIKDYWRGKMTFNYLNNHIENSYKTRQPMTATQAQRNKIENKLVLVCRFGSDKDELMSEIDVLMALVKAQVIEETDCMAIAKECGL